MRAYALMRFPEELEASYQASPFFAKARTHLEALRTKLAYVPFSSYRGIGRYPFSETPECEPGWQWHAPELTDSEPQARALLDRLLGPDDYVTPYPRAFLCEPGYAKQVQQKLVAPSRYEVVELCVAPDHPRQLLGFDIGYWGGGNFSILCDAAVWPLWHPPTYDSFGELDAITSRLNRNGLFPTASSAQRYLDWYKGQAWAETEPSEFTVIGVGNG